MNQAPESTWKSGDGCVEEGGVGSRFIFPLKSGGWKVLLKIKMFEHVFGV